VIWPERLLSQNSELRRIGVWNWSIPAHLVRLSDGTLMNTCPHAGTCARVCYAKTNSYRFSNVLARHRKNLELVLYYGDEWESRMTAEVRGRRFAPTGRPHKLEHDRTDRWLHGWVMLGGRAVRIHDAGDFFALDYLLRWCRVATRAPDVLFYAYSKEVSLLRSVKLPSNFRILFSFGGTEDALIDRDLDRHADVFPNVESLVAAGYVDQEANDLMAVVHPSNRIGIVANNIPTANKRFAGRSMSEMQVDLRA
jgi:hypothetical protein